VDDGWTMSGAGPASCGPPALDLALATGAPVRVTAAGGALVLLGLAGVASAQAGAEITLSGAIAARVCNGSLDGAAALSDTQGPVTIAACPGRDTAAPPRLDRAAPRAADWAAAQQLAGRILVPDSALSRARGAGGGAADVDGN